VSKICLKRGFGWSRSYYSRETLRDSSLARSLVSQGRSREKSRSRKKTLETLRDPTLEIRVEIWRVTVATAIQTIPSFFLFSRILLSSSYSVPTYIRYLSRKTVVRNENR
jgi:hypothetical protein